MALHHFGPVDQRAQPISSQRSLHAHSAQIKDTVCRTRLIELPCLVGVVHHHGARSRRNFAFDEVGQAILLMLPIGYFVILEGSALVNVLRLEAIKLVLSPLDQVVCVEERVLESPSPSMVQFDLFLFGFAQALLVLVRCYFQFWDSLTDGQAGVLLELRQLNVLLLELYDRTEQALHFLGHV